MAGVLRGHSLALEDMAQMAAAPRASDLGPQAVGIQRPLHGTRKMVVKTGPAAAGIELRLGREQPISAPPANVRAGLEDAPYVPENGRSVPLPTITASSSGVNGLNCIDEYDYYNESDTAATRTTLMPIPTLRGQLHATTGPPVCAVAAGCG